MCGCVWRIDRVCQRRERGRGKHKLKVAIKASARQLSTDRETVGATVAHHVIDVNFERPMSQTQRHNVFHHYAMQLPTQHYTK